MLALLMGPKMGESVDRGDGNGPHTEAKVRLGWLPIRIELKWEISDN